MIERTGQARSNSSVPGRALMCIACTLLFAVTVHAADVGALTGQRPLSEEERKEIAEAMRQQEEAFALLSLKIDEYQNLQTACERISDSQEDSRVKSSCSERLNTLKNELSELTARFQNKK